MLLLCLDKITTGEQTDDTSKANVGRSVEFSVQVASACPEVVMSYDS